MKFIPILFSTDMVQAVLDNRKTMTRRTKGLEKVNANPDEIEVKPIPRCIGNESDWGKFYYHNLEEETITIQCPYGQVGDVLWVRESFVPGYFDDGTYGYKADWNKTAAEYVSKPKWEPSIHMPKIACRLFLQVTDIRIERLKDISEKDAKNEGVLLHERGKSWLDYIARHYHTTQFIYHLSSAKDSFRSLWSLINEQKFTMKKIAWRDNPWVWVISFKRINRPSNFL